MNRMSKTHAVLICTALFAALAGAAPANAASCDNTDPAACLLPYPNDHFTKSAKSNPTKLQLDLPADGTPANNAGKRIDVTEWNRLDGFSPGSMAITFVPGLNLQNSKITPITRPQDYANSDAGAVVIDTKTGARWPIYGELDLTADSAANRDLIIRPLQNFTEGHTYVVALRNLRDGSGALIAPSADFKALRDGKASGSLKARKSELEAIFKVTTKAKIDRSSLYLAWKFTVASSKSLTSRLVSMRDQAFKALGDTKLADRKIQGNSPEYSITKVINYTSSENQYLSRRVYGTVKVPCFLGNTNCRPGGTINLDSHGVPHQVTGNWDNAPFVCNIPRSAGEDSTVHEKAFGMLYGHGLVGNYEAITRNDSYAIAGYDYKNVVCGLDLQGMASEDLAVIGLVILPDLSNFKMLPDRLQQGELNYLYMGRALAHPNGLGANAAFQFGGKTVLNGSVGYSGDSQGGILGGAIMSVAPDFHWGSLGVPGINYSTLLDRSVDWPEYATVLYNAYPRDSVQRPLLMALIQQLWDRGEADGYAQHIGKNALPGSPTNTVLLLPAYGDHQVTNFAAEAYARTIGAKLRTPALSADRWGGFNWFWRITDAGASAISGNAMLMMDTGPARAVGCDSWSCAANPALDPDPCGNRQPCLGTPPPPAGNVPPAYGQDPHGVGGGTAEIRRIVSAYVHTGVLPTGCDGKPCGIGGWTPAP